MQLLPSTFDSFFTYVDICGRQALEGQCRGFSTLFTQYIDLLMFCYYFNRIGA